MDLSEGNCVFVTGGAGFIGSAVIRELVDSTDATVVNIDSLTYAGNLEALRSVEDLDRYHFSHTDIRDREGLRDLFQEHSPVALIHLAGESHVDRSIDKPYVFIDTNIMGTFHLLEVVRDYLQKSHTFRFHHVSTDEVYGSLGMEGSFSEDSPYQPRSPYAASKAASDHLVRSWFETYGIPASISNCSNNYGPFQYPEKLIPVVVGKALREESIPVYGTGANVRDWLHVRDHARALILILQKGISGATYNIGGELELTNLEVVQRICQHLDRIQPRVHGKPYSELISFVEDRPGHDFRYAIDSSLIRSELGWTPQENFEKELVDLIYDNMETL